MASASRIVGIVLLTFANMLFIVFPLAAIARHVLDDQPDEGWGYGWILLGPMLMLGFGVAIINVLVVGWYLWKGSPTTLGRVLGVPILVLSVAALAGSVWFYLDTAAETRAENANRDARRAAQEARVNYNNISREHAERLLRLCAIDGFYYTRQTDTSTGNGGELSPTGIMLTSVGGEPERLSIADTWIEELVPKARNAQQRCGPATPLIWHHGSFED